MLLVILQLAGGNNVNGIHQELEDFVDMIFNQLETAKAYCRKLYRFYVKENGDKTLKMISLPLTNQLMMIMEMAAIIY